MNVSLLVLALWASSSMAPLDPTSGKYPSPTLEPSKYPTEPQWVPKEAPKLPSKTTAAKLLWKPGSYAAESLKLPQALPIEQFDAWQQGPAWPQVERGVVVVTDNAWDPARFLAFMVDVKAQKIVAIRDGDKAKHLMIIGQVQQPAEPNIGPGPVIPPSIMQLAGSGAVIILRPPVPPGPGGIPDDLVAKILDSATIASQAGEWMSAVGK